MTSFDWRSLCVEYLEAQRQVERARNGNGNLQKAYDRRSQAIGKMKTAYYKSEGVDSGTLKTLPRKCYYEQSQRV